MLMLFPAPRDPEPDDKGNGFFGVRLIDNGGVSVTAVEPGSPAEKAGMHVNDLILAINAERVPTVNEAREIIARLRPGMSATVEVRRGEKSVLVKIKVGLRPS
jgi:S1-C subfamily serine protease